MSEITDDEMSKVLIFVNKILSKSEDMFLDHNNKNISPGILASAHEIYTLARDCRDILTWEQASKDVVKSLLDYEDIVVMGFRITKSIQNFLVAGEKINAIRELRSLTGCGLVDAKNACERAMQIMNLV